MTERYRDIKQKLCKYAEQDKDMKAVIAIGSSTRSEVPADDFSDLDLIIVTSSPDRWYSGEYPSLLGNVSISFMEPTLGGGKERRCIYDEDRDVDMIIFTPLQFENALKEGVAEWVMNRGWILLYDGGGYAEMIPQFVKLEVHHAVMTKEEYENTVNDFFFHNIWAFKKLRRGELWSAKMCIDCYLKERLLKMIGQYQLCFGDTDIWHDGRFLDRWADSSILDDLKDCFAHYDNDDCRCALLSTYKLFARLARTVAANRGLPYPEKAEACAMSYMTGTINKEM